MARWKKNEMKSIIIVIASLLSLFVMVSCVSSVNMHQPACQSLSVKNSKTGTSALNGVFYKKDGSLILNAINNYPPSPYRFRIFVFTYARPEGLKVTLESILNADYSRAGGVDVDLDLFIDFRRNNSEQMQEKQYITLKMAKEVEWPYGQYRIHRQFVNVGLRQAIMGAWYPTSDREVAAFFEDDVEVSPFWFSWAHDALMQYAPVKHGSIQADPHFIGISLFRPVYDELTKRYLNFSNNLPFFLQQPCSWGAVYLARPWQTFVDFFDKNNDRDVMLPWKKRPRIPSSNRWDYMTSWKKYLIYSMYHHGQYMLYPNFPSRIVLSTSRMLPGEHSTPDKKKFVLPLLSASNLENEKINNLFFVFPEAASIDVYNTFFKKVDSVSHLPNFNAKKKVV